MYAERGNDVAEIADLGVISVDFECGHYNCLIVSNLTSHVLVTTYDSLDHVGIYGAGYRV